MKNILFRSSIPILGGTFAFVVSSAVTQDQWANISSLSGAPNAAVIIKGPVNQAVSFSKLRDNYDNELPHHLESGL